MRTIGKMLAVVIVIVVAAFIGGVLFAPGPTSAILGDALGNPAVEEETFSESVEITGDPYPGDPEAETALVEAEKLRLAAVREAAAAGPSEALDTSEPFRVATSGRATFILPARAEPYGLGEIAGLAPATLSADGPDGAYVLHEHLTVMSGAVLVIRAGETLLLAGDESGFSALVSYGDLRIDGNAEQHATVASWSPATGGEDQITTDGRPYLRVVGGSLQVSFADIRSLGFWSGETGGLSYDGDRTPDSELAEPAPGSDGAPTVGLTPEEPAPAVVQIADTTVTGNAFGLTLAAVEAPTIARSQFVDNLADGLVVDGDVSGAVIEETEASRNARDGVVIDRTTSATELTGLVAVGNGRNGLVLDGTPPADGPNSTGEPAKVSSGFAVTSGTFTDNARAGIDVVGGAGVRISGVDVTGGDMGIVLGGGPRDVEISESSISGQTRHGISVRDDAADVVVSRNDISSVDIGIYVRNAGADVIANTVTDAEKYGIVLTGQLGGSRILDNRLSGTGPSAINDDRAINVRVEGNLIDGWAASRTLDQILTTLMQPLTIVWMLVVTLVIVALITRLGAGRKKLDPLRDPTPLQSLSRGVFDRSEAGRFGS